MLTTPATSAAQPATRSPYRQPLGWLERPWYTATGDVTLFGGRSFGTTFASLDAAVARARERSEGPLGGVAVLGTRGNYTLTRLYNAERSGLAGLSIGQSHPFDAPNRAIHTNASVVAIVDGQRALVTG